MRQERPDEGDRISDAASKRYTRRTALARAAAGGFALSASGALLAACGSSSGGSSTSGSGTPTSGQKLGVGGIPIATKSNPVKLPIFSDNKPIASGMQPEKGPLIVFDWGTYLSPDVIKSFEHKYNVQVQLTTYSSLQEAVKKITTGAIAADVWVPVVEQIPNYVAAKLIHPINHSYIPNLSQAIPSFQSPYYDVDSQYSVPNYIWNTGIGWRNDLISIDPASASNPWDIFWTNTSINGKIGLQNADPFDPLSLGFLRSGITDFYSITEPQVNKSQADIQQLVNKGAKLQYTAFQPLGTGVEVIAQCWNGDILLVPDYLPSGKDEKVISYWFPPDGKGSVNNDFWSIPKTSQNPVLAHMWMNHMLETENAISNFKSVGYQQPLTGITIDSLKKAKVASEYMLDMIYVTDTMATNGLPNPIPTTDQNEWYESAYAALSAGA